LRWGGQEQSGDFRLLSLAAPDGPATVGTTFSTTGAIPMSRKRWEDRSTVTVAARPSTFEFVTDARDFERLATCFAPEVRVRLLLPRGAEEIAGRQEIAARMERWFGSATEFQVVSSGHDEIGPRQRASWRFRLVRDGQSWEQIEQTVFLDFGTDGVQRMDLLCSGFIRESTSESAQIRVFDAGQMGCADGLAQELRRQLTSVPIGGSLVAIVRDPAAREEVPALARMLGHSVTSLKEADEGKFKITMERKR
jgi:TusA-related sulfurtransferase